MNRRGLCTTALVLAIAAGAMATEPAPRESRLGLSTQKDAFRAVDLGLRWLKTQQHEDGSWSLKQYPAITALVTRAILQDPGAEPGATDPAAARGLDYLLSCVREDGGVYCDVPKERGGSLRNYNTAAALHTLAAAHQTRLAPAIIKARQFIVRTQHLGRDVFYGGWGYDLDLERPYADMMNTGFAIEALNATAYLTRPKTNALPSKPDVVAPAEGSMDPDWQAAVAFLSRCQNREAPEEREKPVSPRPQDQGGFYYHPLRGMAGGETSAGGQQMWYSYGNATALGMMCLLEANVNRTDPRVAATVDWFRRNYTLEEHAGLGKQGLYFYYHTLSKALSLYGEEPLKLANRPPANWRYDLAVKLISLQRRDEKTGLNYWVNDEGRWMENDPVLVTSYCVLALETLLAE